MSKFHRAGLLAGFVWAIASSSGHAADQKDIEKAIAAGVKALRAMQTEDGTWPPHREMGYRPRAGDSLTDATRIGATALAGLTLLECGAKPDDKDVLRAADAVRKAGPTLTYNYSICLAILFFDRLGDPGDIPLIESLTVRLLASQTSNGGWSYRSPELPEAEVRRLQAKLADRKELVGRSGSPRVTGVKRSARDVSPEIQQQLGLLSRSRGMVMDIPPDNSNTQFATLALWVGRRYGLPVGDALKRVDTRFRASQNGDGGWGYRDARSGPMGRSMASMTCAGLLGLAVADGNASEMARERNPAAKPPRDINKDSHVRKALLALSQTIGRSVQQDEARGARKAAAIPQIGGRSYYFLWSLERVAVALDLKTIGKKDWFAWGAEILVANQQADGSWQGMYGESGADTCFALLFLKRVNLVSDLTAQIAGRVKDPGERVLKARELQEGIAKEKSGDLMPGIEGKNTKPERDGEYPAEVAKKQQSPPASKKTEPPPLAKNEPPPLPAEKPRARKSAAEEAPLSAVERMAADLAKSPSSRHDLLLRQYRDAKGVEFTEVLALTVPQVSGERQRKVREALAERLTRMKESTLKDYLRDENMEIRVAAARAAALKGSKTLIPQLIPLVKETRGGVAEAAHQTLKELSGQDFGPKGNASRDERVQAARQWTEWWNKQGK